MDFIDFIKILSPHIYNGHSQQDTLTYFCDLITSPKMDAELNDGFNEAIHKYQHRTQKTAVSEIFNKKRPFPSELKDILVNHYDVTRLITELENVDWSDEQELVITAFKKYKKEITTDTFIEDIIRVLNDIIGQPIIPDTKVINNFNIKQTGANSSVIAHADKIELSIGGGNGRNKNSKK